MMVAMTTQAPTRFALGTFQASDGSAFAAIVIDQAVFPVETGESLRDMLEHWHEALPTLQAAADTLAGGPGTYRLDELRPLPPVWS